MSGLFAVVLVDKPVGPSSHDVVVAVRRSLGERRIGHTGTLDPFASGLLLLCVGHATRLVEYFHLLPKTYAATIRFGEGRDTDDHTGEVVATSSGWENLAGADLEEALAADLGATSQRPPDYSALKRGGERAYEAARRGEPLALEERPIEVTEARLLSWEPPDATVLYTVSTGTYIRALARDLGDRLRTHAHLAGLRRTKIGPFDVEAAASPEAAAPDGTGWMTPLGALAWLPQRQLDESEQVDIGHGRGVAALGVSAPPQPQPGLDGDLPVVLHDGAGGLTAVARREDGVLRPMKVFHAP
ncbi:MAG: tRNA pseudouridine(55) synthase TruB [Gemmatimonadota bacterium]